MEKFLKRVREYQGTVQERIKDASAALDEVTRLVESLRDETCAVANYKAIDDALAIADALYRTNLWEMPARPISYEAKDVRKYLVDIGALKILGRTDAESFRDALGMLAELRERLRSDLLTLSNIDEAR